MYITSSVFNIIRKQFEDVEFENPNINSILNIDFGTQQGLMGKVSSDVLGLYIEYITKWAHNNRLGLEKGFSVPITIAGMLYKIYENCNTLKDVFEKSDQHSPTINPLYSYANRIENNLFIHEIFIDDEFSKKYPLATRQLYECQLGISLQIIYTLTGKRIKPIKIHTFYKPEDNIDILSDISKSPIKYTKDEFALVFDSSILDFPVLTANSRLLAIIEDLVNEIKESENELIISVRVRKYLLKSLPTVDVDMKIIARKFNMGERTLQRRLKQEKTSFREILNNVRSELSEKYINDGISFVEIAFLLGFDSQSAFNKFFKKQFKIQPSQFRVQTG